MTAVEDRIDEAPADVSPGLVASNRTLRRVLVAIIAVAVLAIAVAGGFFWGTKNGDTTSAAAAMPTASSVDAGFARDMTTHHQQAVTMAGYVRDNPSDPAVAVVAYDIETAQSVQMGEMEGWLDTWGLPRVFGTEMAWMKGMHMHVAANGLMPGMASPSQQDELLASHGKKMDILFLQLMIRHHQGGVQMAQYAAAHATEPYVRQVANNMAGLQSTEIVQMEQMLRSLGGTPLPPPQ